MVCSLIRLCYLDLNFAPREEAGYLRNTRGVRVQATIRRKKRKAKARAYVVFVGRVPAVYTVWYVPLSSLSDWSLLLLGKSAKRQSLDFLAPSTKDIATLKMPLPHLILLSGKAGHAVIPGSKDHSPIPPMWRPWRLSVWAQFLTDGTW